MKMSQWFLMCTFLAVPMQSIAQTPPSPAEIEAERAAVFSQADADGNGTLSLDEFKTFESLMRDKMTEHHFTHLDANGDGGVSLQELQAAPPGPGFGFGHPPF